MLVIGGVVALILIALVVAWLMGAFAPKMATLPARVGAYVLDTSTQKSSGNTLDSATYRAGAGDIRQASIIKNAPDPTLAYSKAAADARYQAGAVSCVDVSKTAKGGTCSVLLPNGSAVVVSGSTRHAVADLAQFTADVAAGVK